MKTMTKHPGSLTEGNPVWVPAKTNDNQGAGSYRYVPLMKDDIIVALVQVDEDDAEQAEDLRRLKVGYGLATVLEDVQAKDTGDGDGHTLSHQDFVECGGAIGVRVVGLPQPVLVFLTRKYAAGNVREFIQVECTREQLLRLAEKIVTRLGPEEPVTVLNQIAAERERQRSKGYDAKHDDKHSDGSLLRASLFAACEPLPDTWVAPGPAVEPGEDDPWPDHFIKHLREKYVDNPRQKLIIAAALLVAEIERRDRSWSATPPGETS